MNHIHVTFMLSALLLLSGCAHQQVLTGGDKFEWKQHSEQVKNLKSWNMDGKMGVRQDSKGASFNVAWKQYPTEFQLSLSGPLGQGAVSVSGDRYGVTMIDSDGTAHKARSLEQLMAENTDLILPLAQLPYWVKGIADPHYPATISLNENNLAGQLDQLGWTVSYLSYFQLTPPLPQKLKFQQGENSGKLVIKRWEFSETGR
ncbi:lipoprotein insertase outer membrane protein LolB [Gynuella sunshinyii]|uniref:Outer-membrane lipoprotein LolB n=1 Tax=Gynuella sunshinyii YC6258 TaxID=1445510 RepID=A0A0C5W137_9GAMM|nr:lipoprotein insertase outer membrane protein LolB [Gynuella sunshinyii]AJQ96409.1 outer membrane lipoprotein involved in outer membrane biogenesis [Gynuella sunshinyii YC6258]